DAGTLAGVVTDAVSVGVHENGLVAVGFRGEHPVEANLHAAQVSDVAAGDGNLGGGLRGGAAEPAGSAGGVVPRARRAGRAGKAEDGAGGDDAGKADVA